MRDVVTRNSPAVGERSDQEEPRFGPPAVQAGPVSFRAFSGLPGLAEVRTDWRRVTETLTRPRFVHLYPWFEAYARTLADDPAALRVFVAYAGAVPTAVFPMIARSRKLGGLSLRVLEPANDLHLPLCDFVFEKTGANAGLTAALVDFLRGADTSWDALYLPTLLDDSAAWFSLSSLALPRSIVEPGSDCDYLASFPFEQRLESLSKNFRGALRKARNKLTVEPDVEFQSITEPPELDAAFQAFVEVEGSGWKAAQGSAINLIPRVHAFYRALVSGFAPLGGVEINLLRLGGRCIAAQFCLKVARCLYILKIGYDEQRAKLAPGNMLLENVLRRYGAGSDLDEVNLISNAEWHTDWKPLRHQRRTAIVFNRSPRGVAAYLAKHASRRLGPIYRAHVAPRLRRKPS